MNQITHWLDSSNVYGSGDSEARRLRTFQGGKLRSERGLNGAEMLPDNGENDCKGNSRRCFLAGKFIEKIIRVTLIFLHFVTISIHILHITIHFQVT